VAPGGCSRIKVLLHQPPGRGERQPAERHRDPVRTAHRGAGAGVAGGFAEMRQHQPQQLLGGRPATLGHRVHRIRAIGDQPVAQRHLRGEGLVAEQPVCRGDRDGAGQAQRVLGHPRRHRQALVQDLSHLRPPLPPGADKI
jgi:hypothetical protein